MMLSPLKSMLFRESSGLATGARWGAVLGSWHEEAPLSAHAVREKLSEIVCSGAAGNLAKFVRCIHSCCGF